MTQVQNTVKSAARIIAKAGDKTIQAGDREHEITTRECQRVIDTLVADCGTKSRAQYWKENGELVNQFVNNAWIDRTAQDGTVKSADSARRNYKTSLKISFVYGLDFSLSLFKTHSSKDGQPKGDGAKGAKTGAVVTTDKPALVKTLGKALEQARALKLDDTAAGVLDLILEIDPDFAE